MVVLTAGLTVRFMPCVAGEPARTRVIKTWETREDFDRCFRDRNLNTLSEPGTLRLVSSVLIADEMGAGYNNFQPVRGKTQAKKILVIDDPDVNDALLMVDGRVAGCDIVVNGVVLGRQPLETCRVKDYWLANFERYEIPPELLRTGANEFIFRSRDGNSAGRIRVERSRQPNRSSVSRDGGYSWDSERLCEGGYMNGELGVRLRLGRYAPQARMTSPVIDLAAAVTRHGIPAGMKGRLEALEVMADIPTGTGVNVFIRTGETPDGYAENWSHWLAWPLEDESLEFKRFVQWRVELSTRNPRITPVVHGVATHLSVVAPVPADNAPIAMVIEDENERIVRSSHDFAYARHAGNSRILRQRWNLEAVIDGHQTEFEQLKALRQWVREQWNNGWSHGALNYTPSWDARIILTLAPENLSLGMCTHYATVLVQCAQALGFPARSIFHGHALTEIWSNDFKKWVLMDSGADSNDRRRATYHVERDGIPLANLEIHHAYFVDGDLEGIEIKATNMSLGTEQEEPPFRGSADAFDRFLRDGDIEGRRQMFMELRNHFVDHREPEEPQHGMTYFKYLGHLGWRSEHTPEIPWTDFFTTREADLYWTLNQAQIYLLKDSEAAEKPRVMLDTVTPNFAGYEIRFNGGDWLTWRRGAGNARLGPVSVEAYPMRSVGGCVGFTWELAAGRNMIEARPFNEAGRRGITSRMVVELIVER